MISSDTQFWMAVGLMVSICAVIVSYGCSRAASIAYFRTKLEYMRSIVKLNRRNHGKE